VKIRSGVVEQSRQQKKTHNGHYNIRCRLRLQQAAPSNNLSILIRQISVLSREQTRLAELDPTQSVAERVLRQGATRRQEARQGQLLDARSRQLQHVRQRQLPAPAATVQEEGRAERARRTRAATETEQRRPGDV